MTLAHNIRTRTDLDIADRVINACSDNFKATEPTFVLRDLIAIELAKSRETEREMCAKICDDYSARAWSAQYPSQEAAVAASNLAKAIRSEK